jgi:hypothetical protein
MNRQDAKDAKEEEFLLRDLRIFAVFFPHKSNGYSSLE